MVRFGGASGLLEVLIIIAAAAQRDAQDDWDQKQRQNANTGSWLFYNDNIVVNDYRATGKSRRSHDRRRQRHRNKFIHFNPLGFPQRAKVNIEIFEWNPQKRGVKLQLGDVSPPPAQSR